MASACMLRKPLENMQVLGRHTTHPQQYVPPVNTDQSIRYPPSKRFQGFSITSRTLSRKPAHSTCTGARKRSWATNCELNTRYVSLNAGPVLLGTGSHACRQLPHQHAPATEKMTAHNMSTCAPVCAIDEIFFHPRHAPPWDSDAKCGRRTAGEACCRRQRRKHARPPWDCMPTHACAVSD